MANDTELPKRRAPALAAVLSVCIVLLVAGLLLGACEAVEEDPGTLPVPVTVSGTISYPGFSTGGQFQVVAVDGQDNLVGSLVTVPAGASAPYTAELPANAGSLLFAAMYDHDSDDEATGWIEPSAAQTIFVGSNPLTGVDFTVQDGGLVNDFSGKSPHATFTQNKPWPGHFSHIVGPSTAYTVSTANAGSPIDLAVYEDVNDNNQYDAGTDTAFCSPANVGSGTESCQATTSAGATRLIALITVEGGSPGPQQIFFDISVQLTSSVTLSGTISYPDYSVGQFAVVAFDAADNLLGYQIVAGGTSVPYSVQVPPNAGAIQIVTVLDHDYDEEFIHFVEPCHLLPATVGSVDQTGFDFAVQDGGCLEDMQGVSPYAGFAQAKPWPSHFSQTVSGSTAYTVSTGPAFYPVDLAVYEDTNANNRYDAGADAPFCASTVPNSGDESCQATTSAGATRLIILVSVEGGASQRDVGVAMSVE